MKFVPALAAWACLFPAWSDPAPAATSEPADWIGAWRPVVETFGGGDPHLAVQQLREVIAMFDAMFAGVVADSYTIEFVDDVNSELRSFDLDDFFETLPERSPTWHWLALAGRVHGGRYEVGKAPAVAPGKVTPTVGGGGLGGMAALLRAQPVGADHRGSNYLLQSEFDLALARFAWSDLMRGSREFLRLSATIDGAALRVAPSGGAAVPANVDLRARAVLDLLAQGFPTLAAEAGRLIVFDRLRIERREDGAYYHIRGKVRVDVESMEQRYESLADYLDDLDELVRAQIHWIDPQGRTLVRFDVDSRDVVGSFDFSVVDGHLAPFAGDHVFADQAVDPMGNGLENTRVLVTSRIEVLGLEVDVDDFDVGVNYTPSAAGMAATASIRRVPRMAFGGRALGLFPPGMIDLFIPGNMHQLVHDFMRVAVEGNDGKGIAAEVAYRRPESSPAGAVETHIGFEALNNFVVKFAVRAAIKRLLPGADERRDIVRLIADLRAAFHADLDRFESAVALTR